MAHPGVNWICILIHTMDTATIVHRFNGQRFQDSHEIVCRRLLMRCSANLYRGVD